MPGRLSKRLMGSRPDLYEAMLQQGLSTAPVGHWAQGLARLAQAYVGMEGLKGLEEKAAAEDAATQKAIMDAFAMRQDPGPEVQGPVQPVPEDMRYFAPSDQKRMIDRAGTRFQLPVSPPVNRMPSMMEAAQGLMQNPETQSMAAQLMMKSMEDTASRKADFESWKRQYDVQRQGKMADVQDERAYQRGLGQEQLAAKMALAEQAADLKQPKYGTEVPYPPDVYKQREALAKARGGDWQTVQGPGGVMYQRSPTGKLENLPTPPAPTLSKGQEAIDKEFGKEYVKTFASGGFSDAMKSLDQINEVVNRLESGQENLTGPVLGRAPDAIRSITNPEAVDVQNTIEELVQRNLRVILGAQFTEKEGERLIARAYNPVLDEKTNAKRVRRLMSAMKQAAEAKKNAAVYFEKNGTLHGYKGTTQFSISDFNKAIEDSSLDNEGMSQNRRKGDRASVGRFQIEVE